MIPKDVADLLDTLKSRGFEAWCAGGCVRDLLLERPPRDWDVTTAAPPEETMRIFGDSAVPTGIRHGTVTVLTGKRPVEVTTFRADGIYKDHRHPQTVTFSGDVLEDLRRRDFTVNAMAMGKDGTILDPCGGQKDLEAGILRCVGDADTRFDEDALRILRCIRFASELGFQIEKETEAALRRKRKLLEEIAAERIRMEFVRLLCGKNARCILQKFPDVLEVFLPEIRAAVGFNQQNPHHCYDVWEHTARSVEAAPPDEILRMTLLLHDLGKPACFTVDQSGCGHFFGHSAVSGRMAAEILTRLRFGREESETILLLVEQHDRVIVQTERGVRRALLALGEKNLRMLLEIKRADNLAQAPEFRVRQREIDRVEQMMDDQLAAETCFSLRKLAVHGNDLLAAGFRGREIGKMLDFLLRKVVDGELENDRETLLEEAVKQRGSV